ncbi:hypothetical protein MRX96_035711 [Rhipicephalus microplus]
MNGSSLSASWVGSIGIMMSTPAALSEVPGLRHTSADGSTLLFPAFGASEFRDHVHSTSYRCVLSNALGKKQCNGISVVCEESEGSTSWEPIHPEPVPYVGWPTAFLSLTAVVVVRKIGTMQRTTVGKGFAADTDPWDPAGVGRTLHLLTRAAADGVTRRVDTPRAVGGARRSGEVALHNVYIAPRTPSSSR